MSLIAIHVGLRPSARIWVDLEASRINKTQPDFPWVSGINGTLEGVAGRVVTERSHLGSLFSAIDWSDLRSGQADRITISCGTQETFLIEKDENAGRMGLALALEGRSLPLEGVRIGDLLTEDQRHFATRIGV